MEINSASEMLGSSHFYFPRLWLVSIIPKTSKSLNDSLDIEQFRYFLAIKKEDIILENIL